MSNNINKWQPFIYALVLATGLALGIYLRPANSVQTFMGGGKDKLSEMLNIIEQSYVDTVDTEALEEQTLNQMLSELDPHSVYIPAADLSVANEQLDGNFEGIGVEFNIIDDSILVVSAINGGPAQELGVMPGDRIIKVDSINVAGNGITSEKVFKLLRGKGGSQVIVTVFRPGTKEKIPFNITRRSIPIYSVDAWRMLNQETGYIKISRFAENTHDEFMKAFKELKAQKLQHLVLDLRGNPGGYLSTAIQLVDEFIEDRKLIVYTEGRNKPRAEYRSERNGVFEQGKLIVLIDEGSASASEILSGAVQDWDRGMVIGRRSFGKGLVQEPYSLKDGSALRLTVSRYYTPSGRCIQKDYTDKVKYDHDLIDRYQNGELESNTKSIFDSTPYYTKRLNRIVYGGGGIYPDIFVPIDTSYYSPFLTRVVTNALISKFSYEYLDKNRKAISAIKSLDLFASSYQIAEQVYQEFIQFAVMQGVPQPTAQERAKSADFIKTQIKALVARQIWRDQGFYKVMQKDDLAIKAALKALQQNQALLGSNN
jgi:carboxyl-terminal processing protease